jgi:Asp-tRNA(Asn)/Glu-tRNA(Gln) amidotransferase C subunit
MKSVHSKEHSILVINLVTMSKIPVSYFQVEKKVTREVARRRPPPDPFVRNLKIREFLRHPTWSVKSLLPDPTAAGQQAPTVTPKQLHHLLRLSALPQPKDAEEESSMLKTLETQLHFVREIQKVDTTGVEPLVSIRDETPEAVEENTISLADLQEELDAEQKIGMHGRVKRVARDDPKAKKAEDWDLFKMAHGKTVGRFFVVRKEKENNGKTVAEQSGP